MAEIPRYIFRAVGWFQRLRRLLQREKTIALKDVGLSLENLKKLLEEQLAKETDPEKRQAIQDRLEEICAAQRGYYMARLESGLERSGIRPYDALVANGKGILQPENKAKLTEAVKRLELLPPPPTAEHFMASATAKYALKRYDEALADYNRALELRPDYPEALNNRGNTFDELERYDEALADYNRAIELRPDDPVKLKNRGTSYTKMERYDEALADFNKALELKPDYAGALYNLACLFSLTDRPDEAISHLEKAIGMGEKYRQDATKDSDFDNIRDDPRFRKLIEAA